MANWCSNRLDVAGSPAHVAAFKAAIRPDATCPAPHDDTDVLCLYRIVPVPAEADPSLTASAWGTKWDITRSAVTEDGLISADPDGNVQWQVEFDSAWTPPLRALTAAAKAHPDVEIGLTYDEPGNDIGGTVIWIGGELVEHLDQPPSGMPGFTDDPEDDAAPDNDEFAFSDHSDERPGEPNEQP